MKQIQEYYNKPFSYEAILDYTIVQGDRVVITLPLDTTEYSGDTTFTFYSNSEFKCFNVSGTTITGSTISSYDIGINTTITLYNEDTIKLVPGIINLVVKNKYKNTKSFIIGECLKGF